MIDLAHVFPLLALSEPSAFVEDLLRVLSLRDYNTRVVLFGTAALGLSAGLVGSFTLLRKRALMGDALAHATFPGIVLAFIVATLSGLDGKRLGVLLFGAAVSGLLGVGTILLIRRNTLLKEDTALSIVLSVFFGFGAALLGIVQNMPSGNAAGLESFIYGKTASMVAADALLISSVAVLTSIVSILFFKELTILCFDDGFANARGFPVLLLDIVLMGLVVLVTIVGLQAVGLVLMIALLVIPASAARFWTERIRAMAVISAIIGLFSCLIGAAASAVLPRLPSGAMIVLVSGFVFAISMVFGSERGVVVRWLRRTKLNQRIDRDHVLRGAYELIELDHRSTKENTKDPRKTNSTSVPVIEFEKLLEKRTWTVRRLALALLRCEDEGLLRVLTDRNVQLSKSGEKEAARLTREHRLWEIYLITHAEIAPSRVDRNADNIEHVLGPEMIAELEDILKREKESQVVVPDSPHVINTGTSLLEIRDNAAASRDEKGTLGYSQVEPVQEDVRTAQKPGNDNVE